MRTAAKVVPVVGGPASGPGRSSCYSIECAIQPACLAAGGPWQVLVSWRAAAAHRNRTGTVVDTLLNGK